MFKYILSMILLVSGILLAILITPTFLLAVGLPIAVYALSTKRKQRYALSVWVGFDKFMNACLGGDHRETVSSRLGKSIDHGCPTVFLTKRIDKLIYDCLGVIDENHCTKSIDWSVGRSYN